jgi:hypothetical protein
MTLIHCVPLPTMIVSNCLQQSDGTKHQCFMLLRESTSLSQIANTPNPMAFSSFIHFICPIITWQNDIWSNIVAHLREH